MAAGALRNGHVSGLVVLGHVRGLCRKYYSGLMEHQRVSNASVPLLDKKAFTTRGFALSKQEKEGGGETRRDAAETTRATESSYAHLLGFPLRMYTDRSVTIYAPSKSAMQSGMGKLGYWKMALDKRDRWENPLMGWSSTADPLNHVFRTIKFESKEDAVRFAEKHGFTYSVAERQAKAKMTAKSYAAKFHCDNRKGTPVPPAFKGKADFA